LLFLFRAEDGIRGRNVTGVQTCALPIFILFGENSITDNLEKVSVVQRFENVQSADITINNEIKIDDQVYTVKFKGDLVDSNFSMLGHVTLYFTEVPDEPQNNAIYLSPEKMPSIHVGSTIERSEEHT